MSYNTNFDLDARIEGNHVNVTGTSNGKYEGLDLISRHFILEQGQTLRHRQAEETRQGNWKAVRPMTADGFEKGPAVVLGTETYYLKRDGAPATFVSLTWSQAIEIT